jgi:adenosylcobyric acid synthase
VDVAMIPPGTPIPAEAALIVLPGSKATMADLAFLRAEGWDIDVLAHYRRGGLILGICGGFQMLGKSIADPLGIEGKPGDMAGLGLLDVTTVLGSAKALREVSGSALGVTLNGFEMHLGVTERHTGAAFAMLEGGRADGAIDASGRVLGTYCHGLFASTDLRAELLARLGAVSDRRDHHAEVDAALDALADAMEAHLDIDGLLALTEISR